MKKLEIDGEELDVSESGCWFDPGELVSILSRNHNFLPSCELSLVLYPKLKTGFPKKNSLLPAKRKLNQLYQLHIKTGDSVYRSAISDFESHLKNKQHTTYTSSSHNSSTSSSHQELLQVHPLNTHINLALTQLLSRHRHIN